MKILIYGAGVIGSIYASRLFEAAQDVTILARGKRFEEIKRRGITLENSLSRVASKQNVPVINQLLPSDVYELIIVAVRLDQIDSVILNLRENKGSALLMFMLNYPEGLRKIEEDLPNKQILMGFPGLGGTMQGDVVKFVEIKQQKTTIGALCQEHLKIISALRQLFEKAGFKTEISSNVGDWLKTHAVFISCMSASIINFNGKSEGLANSKTATKLLVQSVREGFRALECLGVLIEPKNLKLIFVTMPIWFSVWYWQKALRSDLGKLAIAPHVEKAKEEMQLVAEKTLSLLHKGKTPTLKLDSLLNNFIKES